MRCRYNKISRSPAEEDSSLLNLTPLIDVVFVVLILFILIAPMLDVDHIKLAPSPPLQTAAASTTSPIAIYVKADNSIWMHKKQLSYEELLQALRIEYRQHPQTSPQLFHDTKAQFGTYQSIKNIVELAGFQELDVILQPGAS